MQEEQTNYTIEEQKLAFESTVQIKVETLAKIMKLIDVSCERAVFKAAEMSHIGKIYDSLAKGVNQALLNTRNNIKKGKMPNQMPNQMSNQTSQMPTHVPNQMSNQMSNQMPNHVPNQMPINQMSLPQNYQQNMPQISQNVINVPVPKPEYVEQQVNHRQSNNNVPQYNPDISLLKEKEKAISTDDIFPEVHFLEN